MATKPCCGSKGPRHKKGCTGAVVKLPKPATKPQKRTGGGSRSKRRPARAEPATVSSNGHGPAISDNAAKKSGEQFLGHLLRVRDSLDAKITSVRELLAVL